MLRYALHLLYSLSPFLILPLPAAAIVNFQNPLTGQDSLLGVVCSVRDGLFPILLTFAIIAFIAAGLFYLYAQGNEQRLNTAKKLFYAAVIGTLIAILAWGLPSIITQLFLADPSKLPTNCQ